MVSVARASIFAGVLGGLDLEQSLADCFRGGLVAGGLVGGAGGQQFGEVVAAAGADDVAGEEPSLAPSPWYSIPETRRSNVPASRRSRSGNFNSSANSIDPSPVGTVRSTGQDFNPAAFLRLSGYIQKSSACRSSY